MSGIGLEELKALLPLLHALHGDNDDTGDFQIGERINIELSADILELMQDGHGGWNPEMVRIINVPGTVEMHMRDNDYLVDFDNGLKFCVNSAAFTRLNEAVQKPTTSQIKPGDIVKFDSDVEKIKRLQEDYGGFNDRMENLAGKYGYVSRRTLRQFGVLIGPFKFGWNPELLTRLSQEEIVQVSREYQIPNTSQTQISKHDIVEVSKDLESVKSLQKGHGEWVDSMEHIIGKYGFVKRVFPTNDLRLRVQGRTWTVNPLSCRLIIPAQVTSAGSERKEKPPQEDPISMIKILLQSVPSNENIFQAAADGDLALMKRLETRAVDFNEKLDKFDVIHVAACYRENVEILEYLIRKDPNKLKLTDREGNTALHLAAMCGLRENISCLLDKGADLRARDNLGQSPLHKAVWKDCDECVQLLINKAAPINMRDSEYGHTPLHDAITYKAHKTAKILINQGAKLTLENNSGFSPVFWAALKGESEIFRYILDANGISEERLLNARMREGFSILHLLAVNNHADCFQDVMDHFPNVNLDVFATPGSVTPLHLASIKLIKEMVQLLLLHGANPNVKDKDGDTPLHLCMHGARKKSVGGGSQLEKLKALLESALGGDRDQIVKDICVCLLNAGANLYEKNLMGKAPLDLCPNIELATFIVTKASEINVPIRQSFSGDPSPSTSQSSSSFSQPSSSSAHPSSSKLVKSKSLGESEHSLKQDRPQQTAGSKSSLISNIGRAKTEMVGKNHSQESSSSQTREYTNVADSKECKICRDKSADVELPCAHRICHSCCQRLSSCPYCRTAYDREDFADFQSLK